MILSNIAVRMTFVAIGLVAISGCGGRPSEVTLFVSGDTQGWITPCGCASNQSGGLARRATVLHDAAEDHEVIYFDAGGSAIGTGEYQTLKLASLLRGMKEMGLMAHNIGEPETEFSISELAKLSTDTGVSWLSTNLVSSEEHSPVQHSSIQVKQEFEKAGLRFLVLGVVDPSLVKSSDWSAKDALPTILDSLDQYQSKHGHKPDITVVLAYFEESGLRKLAESLPEVNVIIGGPTGQALSPISVGPVKVMSATNKGKFLARVNWRRNDAGKLPILTDGIVEVASQLDEQPSQLANLKDYYQRLELRDFKANESQLVTASLRGDDGYAIAGSEACLSCHTVDNEVWHNSKHSHAFDVLVTKGAHYDPHCQQCHTTGYGVSDGFINVSASKNRYHVGCENCHGPSKSHAIDPKKRTPFLAKEQCIRCHDHENSPEFQFDAYWSKIAHAGTKL